jgi:hypothetical protein
MTYYSDVSDFVSGCARIARSFSWRDAKDALSNPYINIHLEDYHIIFSYGEGGSLFPARLQFDVVNKVSGDLVARFYNFHVYDGDRDDLPIIPPSKADRIASEITEAILRDEETQE